MLSLLASSSQPMAAHGGLVLYKEVFQGGGAGSGNDVRGRRVGPEAETGKLPGLYLYRVICRAGLGSDFDDFGGGC